MLDCTNLVFVVSAAAAAAPPPSAGAAADVAAAVEAGGGAGEGEVGSAAAPPISTSGGCAVDMAFFRTRQNTLKYNRTLVTVVAFDSWCSCCWYQIQVPVHGPPPLLPTNDRSQRCQTTPEPQNLTFGALQTVQSRVAAKMI